jgi:vacuolar-type H+-ATPase subunit I/STV1
MAETLEQIKKRLAEEEKALREKYASKLAAARKREARERAIEAKKLRATENHGKFILAGFVLAEAKKTKNLDLLNRCLSAAKTDRDKAAIKALIDSLR